MVYRGETSTVYPTLLEPPATAFFGERDVIHPWTARDDLVLRLEGPDSVDMEYLSRKFLDVDIERVHYDGTIEPFIVTMSLLLTLSSIFTVSLVDKSRYPYKKVPETVPLQINQRRSNDPVQ